MPTAVLRSEEIEPAGVPSSFALTTAAGDSLTAVLDLVSVVALRKRWQSAWILAWSCNLVGIADLAIALPHAASIGAARLTWAGRVRKGGTWRDALGRAGALLDCSRAIHGQADEPMDRDAR